MKITQDTTLVADKDNPEVRRCPGCWRREGQNHDDECVVRHQRQVEASEEMSPFLENALKIQREAKAKRRPKRIASPASTPSGGSRVGGSVIGKVGDVVDDVYCAVRNTYVGQKLQVIIETPEAAAEYHVRDIPGKHIPIEGQMICRLQARGKKVVGHVTFTLKGREIVASEFTD